LSLSAEAMQYLADRGLTMAEVIEVARLNSSRADSAMERRRAYDREPLKPYTPRFNDHRVLTLERQPWWELRDAIIERDAYACAYCDDHDGATLTADHVVPLARGGSNDPRNLVCCCLPCNSSKRDQLLSEWPGRQTTRRVRDFSNIVGLEA
jgi:5-methylcytosine-specific restriction endonuclease McrA